MPVFPGLPADWTPSLESLNVQSVDPTGVTLAIVIRLSWPTPVAITSPFEYQLLPEDVAFVIATNVPADVTADGISIGSTSGDPPSLSWTPTTVDYDVTLVADNGDSTNNIKVAVREANHLDPDITTWPSKNGTTVDALATDPGGRSYYRVHCLNTGLAQHWVRSANPSPAMTTNDVTYQFRYKPGPGWDKILIQTVTSPNAIFYYDHVTGDSKGSYCSAGIVDVDADGVVTVQMCPFTGVPSTSILFQYAGRSGIEFTPLVDTDGSEYVDMYSDTDKPPALIIDGRVPHSDFYKFFARATGMTSGLVGYNYNSHFVNSITDSIQDYQVRILLPDDYDPGQEYPLVVVLTTEYQPNVFADELQVMLTANLHNTYQYIAVRMTVPSTPWWGSKNDGTMNYERLICGSLIPWMRSRYPIRPGRDGVSVMGFSKGGFGAYALILRNPDVIGYALAWDVPWTRTYSYLVTNGFGVDVAYGTEAHFNTYSPALIADDYVASVSDKRRLVLHGEHTFAADLTGMQTILANLGIDFHFNSTHRATHAPDSGWMTPGVAALAGLW